MCAIKVIDSLPHCRIKQDTKLIGYLILTYVRYVHLPCESYITFPIMLYKRANVDEIKMFLIILEEIDFLGVTLQLETFVFLFALCSFAFCFVVLLRIPNEFDLWHAIHIKLNNSNKWFFLFILFLFLLLFCCWYRGLTHFLFFVFYNHCWYDSDSCQYDRASVRAHV